MNNLLNMFSVELDDNFSSEYVGITIYNGNPRVVFPRGYNLSLDREGQIKDVILLIKVFNKYIRKKSKDIYLQELNDLFEGVGNEFPIVSALWLLKDYENNGLYNEYINRYKRNKNGNINWLKTIKTQIPYLNNKNLIYLDFISKEKLNNINNIILLIQKYIIEKCVYSIGWIYPNINIKKGNKLPYNNEICINLLKKELILTNIDNKKQLIFHMIKFLQYAGKEKSDKVLREYKTKYFMHIWEDMLNEILGNEDRKKYYPNAVWNIEGKNINASNLRPDIILKKDKKIYVLDAKYYKYGITNKISDLPQSSDITKQLLYSKYIESQFSFEAYDAFILPFNSKGSNKFKFIGNANIDIDGFKERKVVCILADTKKIMEQYVNMNETEILKDNIIDIINFQNNRI